MRFKKPSTKITALFLKYLNAYPAVSKLKVLLLADSSQTKIGKVVTLNPIQFGSCNYEYCIIFNESLFEKIPFASRRIMAKQLVLLLENQVEKKLRDGCYNDGWKPFKNDKYFFKEMTLLDKQLGLIV